MSDRHRIIKSPDGYIWVEEKFLFWWFRCGVHVGGFYDRSFYNMEEARSWIERKNPLNKKQILETYE